MVAVFLVGVAASSSSAYPIVAHLGGVPVRAPGRRDTWGICPSSTIRLDRSQVGAAGHAVLAALPTIARFATPPLNLRGAQVTLAVPTHRNGAIMPTRRSCWGTPFTNSALVEVFLPAERAAPALRGNPWFYVAHTRTDWVIWDEPH